MATESTFRDGASDYEEQKIPKEMVGCPVTEVSGDERPEIHPVFAAEGEEAGESRRVRNSEDNGGD